MFTIHLFGTTTIHTSGRVLDLDELPGGKPRRLLEMVALARGAVVSKPVLADQLWSGRPPPHAIATVETYVAVLRRSVQPGVAGRDTVIRTAAGGYRLDGRRARLDLDDFDETAAAAARADPGTAAVLWQRALGIAGRPLLEHEPDAEWAHEVREDYARRAVQAAVRGSRAALAAGDLDLAIFLADDATRRDPLTEDGWQAVIEAHGRAGRPAAAARAAAACLELLASELGVYPSPLTRRLLQAAVAGDTVAAHRPLAAAAG